MEESDVAPRCFGETRLETRSHRQAVAACQHETFSLETSFVPRGFFTAEALATHHAVGVTSLTCEQVGPSACIRDVFDECVSLDGARDVARDTLRSTRANTGRRRVVVSSSTSTATPLRRLVSTPTRQRRCS